MTVDQPIDFGLQDFCAQCKKCAVQCPCDAISLGNKIVFNGYEMWKPDVERCTLYRVTNPGGASCGRCMKLLVARVSRRWRCHSATSVRDGLLRASSR